MTAAVVSLEELPKYEYYAIEWDGSQQGAQDIIDFVNTIGFSNVPGVQVKIVSQGGNPYVNMRIGNPYVPGYEYPNGALNSGWFLADGGVAASNTTYYVFSIDRDTSQVLFMYEGLGHISNMTGGRFAPAS